MSQGTPVSPTDRPISLIIVGCIRSIQYSYGSSSFRQFLLSELWSGTSETVLLCRHGRFEKLSAILENTAKAAVVKWQ